MPKTALKAEQSTLVEVEGKTLAIRNLDKVYFPESGISKGELIQFYTEMAPVILPYIKESPFTMVRYPDGISGEYFYQKECPPTAPAWVKRYRDPRSEQSSTYVVCDNLATLVYLINLGCIEIHAWASTMDKPDYPAWAVFDLDPDPPSGVREALQVARWLGEILLELKMKFLVKTSGASGIHVLLPIEQRYTYSEVQQGIGGMCKFLVAQRRAECTIERSTKKREGKVYIDYLQNGRGRTMAGIYSVRPTKDGKVSTPLLWQEVSGIVDPARFHVRNFQERIREVGDLAQVMSSKNDFSPILHYFT
ncbi:MAG: non-homologous end-joining DNA ligase [Desulfitobacteriaceae bacterium]